MMVLRISEIFGPTIQGEGALIGEPTVFVRSGGCDYRCSWCDSMHAVDTAHRHQWKAMTSEEIWQDVKHLSGGKPLLVTLSGGNPALQNFGALIALGKAQHYRFACETQGSIAREWFQALDMLVLSPKPPSSGERTDWKQFEACLAAARNGPAVVMKIVVFDETDYAFAREAAHRYCELPLYLQPGNPDLDTQTIVLENAIKRLRWLVERVKEDQWYSVRVLPQLHVLLWGNEQGV